MAGLTYTKLLHQPGSMEAAGISNLPYKYWFGSITFDDSYASGGEALSAAAMGMSKILAVIPCISGKGVVVGWNGSTSTPKLDAYRTAAISGTASGTLGSEAAHTHAVALDSGSSAAGSAHGHAFGTISASGAATGAGSSHSHAVALDGGASGAGDAHTHAFTATGSEYKFVSVLSSGQATASTQGTAENADENAAQSAGSASWRSATTVAAGAWTVGALGSHPLTPCAAVIQIQNPTGGNLNLYEGVMTFTVTGTDPFGTAQNETITFTSTGLNKEVVAAKYRWKIGLKAFATITNVTLDNVPANDLSIAVGWTSKLFMGAIVPEASVIQVIEDGSAIAITGNVNATYGTFAHGALAATKVCTYLYKITTGATGTLANESTHTHGPGTLVDAASGAEAAHTHAAGAITVAGTTADESTHTHGPGTLADAASGVGSSHTHAVTSVTLTSTEADLACTATTNLSALSAYVFVIGV